jgi:hypothetical protein
MYIKQTNPKRNDAQLAEIIKDAVNGDIEAAKDSLSAFSCLLDGLSVNQDKTIQIIQDMSLDKSNLDQAKLTLLVTGAFTKKLP